MSDMALRLNLRIEELGAVGKYIQSKLPSDVPEDFISRGLAGQICYIESLLEGDSTDARLSAISASILLADVSFQVKAGNNELLEILENIFPRLSPKDMPGFKKRGGRYVRDYTNFCLSKERKLRFFPIKENPAARNKANIKFSDLIEGIRKFAPHTYNDLNICLPYMLGMSNDQACNYSIMALCLDRVGLNGVRYAIGMFYSVDTCKGLSILIKSIGLNNTKLGGMLCECQCLLGRGVSPIDLVEKTKERCGDNGKNMNMPTFTDEELEASIDYIIYRELDVDKVSFPTLDEFWDSRWLWCKNGGHSRTLEKHAPEYATKMKGRIHRRVAAESWYTNPLYNWDGSVYISASAKLEQGKTRLVLASDTVSYMGFEYFFAPIEKAWRNDRILLNPDSGGHLGTAKRVLSMDGNIWVMLDYDDFNSQHTLRAQEIVIERLARASNFNEPLLEKLKLSFYRMRAFAEGVDCGYITNTLMSGHRGTTILNSILNAAYIHATSPNLWNEFKSLHTGDDIVSRFNSYTTIQNILFMLSKRKLRLNPLKQSVGCYSAEFLRLSISEKSARGYLPRSIASFVSGNWSTDYELGTEEYITSIIGMVRSMLNRGAPETLAYLLSLCLRKRIGIGTKKLLQLLLGTKALGQGPVFGYTYIYSNICMYNVDNLDVNSDNTNSLNDLDSYATNSYLTNKVTPIERTALHMSGFSVKDTMLTASYAKTLASRTEDSRTGKAIFSYGTTREVRGSVVATSLLKRQVFEGYLSRYPVIGLIKNRLKTSVIIELLRMIGKYTIKRSVDELAWGNSRQGNIIIGTMSYSDACMFSNRIASGLIYADYAVYM